MGLSRIIPAMFLRRTGDVDLDGIADGDTLVWDAATSKFIPGTGGGDSGLTYTQTYEGPVTPVYVDHNLGTRRVLLSIQDTDGYFLSPTAAQVQAIVTNTNRITLEAATLEEGQTWTVTVIGVAP